jgi:hypothetical protein
MSTNLIAILAGGGLVALLAAVVAARCLMAAGYVWADALVIEAVALIGAIGAVQSYTSLRWLALLGDLPEWMADIAPATVDVIAAVFGLAALSARRRGPRDRYADWLALGYSVAAVLANVAAAAFDVSTHPDYSWARIGVVLLWHTAPVVTFLLGSHWLMRRRVEVRDVGAEVASLRAELEEARAQVEESRRALVDGRQLASRRAASLTEGRTEPEPKRSRSGSESGGARTGARHAEMRALLAEPGGHALTGKEIGERLGIDPGYARRLRGEVLEAEHAPALAVVSPDGAQRNADESTADEAAGTASGEEA